MYTYSVVAYYSNRRFGLLHGAYCGRNLGAHVRVGREEVEFQIDGFQIRVCVLMPWALPCPLLSSFNPFVLLPMLGIRAAPYASRIMDHPTAPQM